MDGWGYGKVGALAMGASAPQEAEEGREMVKLVRGETPVYAMVNDDGSAYVVASFKQVVMDLAPYIAAMLDSIIARLKAGESPDGFGGMGGWHAEGVTENGAKAILYLSFDVKPDGEPSIDSNGPVKMTAILSEWVDGEPCSARAGRVVFPVDADSWEDEATSTHISDHFSVIGATLPRERGLLGEQDRTGEVV